MAEDQDPQRDWGEPLAWLRCGACRGLIRISMRTECKNNSSSLQWTELTILTVLEGYSLPLVPEHPTLTQVPALAQCPLWLHSTRLGPLPDQPIKTLRIPCILCDHPTGEDRVYGHLYVLRTSDSPRGSYNPPSPLSLSFSLFSIFFPYYRIVGTK
ncbi:hypothetical protein HGM15179_002417 [Zosterops borbonicus]|uniref:Uncharacterized protein n=1 Tax=Zosterops borbonicus TaxID=364589 RepID=A0A8K1GWP1_9PASS|nr:hypothetical protein HGM15179_002417 [Zosterops borbonicus]